MADVSLLRCTEYSLDGLKRLMLLGLGQAGFAPEGFRSLKVLMKPNLLSAAAPESGVVTHPVFFRAAAEIVLDFGGRPVLAESPAVASLGSALRVSGCEAVIEKLGIQPADLADIRKISNERARVFKSFEVAGAFLDADLILNLPKFKTHNLTYVTGAVKNLFGAVPGLRKSELHLKCPDKRDFSGAILDLYGAFLFGHPRSAPLLHVMDAITALEGEGPGSSGRPRAMNAVIVGRDALAVDWVAVQVSGLDPALCPILTEGFTRGFGVASGGEVRVHGQRIDEMRLIGFVPPSTYSLATGILALGPVKGIMRRLFIGRPVPLIGTCVMCGQCRKICPARAIADFRTEDAAPRFDYGRCIRCWCCMEACPHDAIEVRKGALHRLMR